MARLPETIEIMTDNHIIIIEEIIEVAAGAVVGAREVAEEVVISRENISKIPITMARVATEEAIGEEEAEAGVEDEAEIIMSRSTNTPTISQ